MKAMVSLCRAVSLSIGSLLLLITMSLSAQAQSTKSLTDTLDVQDITSLEITNQYGDIVVSTWDRDEIGYDVQITVVKDDSSAADDLLDRLVYSVEEFNSTLTFDYEIEELNAGFFERLWSDITLEIDQSAIQIDVELTLPSGLDLEITNKFGDITIRDWEGDLTIKQKHGDVKVSGNVVSLRLDQSFGDADFDTVESARVDIRNVEFRAKTISDFNIESHGSVINLGNADKLSIDSNKDDMSIDQVKKLKGSVDYGTFYIQDLVDEIQASLRLTDLTIKNIISDSAIITIDQTNSEVEISVGKNAMELHATLEDGMLNVPKSDSDLETNIIDKKDNKRTITGALGVAPKGKITIIGKKGVVVIK